MMHAMRRSALTLGLAATCVGFAFVLFHLTGARAEPQGGEAEKATTEAAATGPRPSVDEICRTLAQAAADNGLPEEFFTRLIWQESRFDPTAVSPAGAQGIAQFMPQTAAMRGLIDAFEPLQALRESASYLRELRTTFRGNLGLAAAAYNAGPGQVDAWLAGRGSLPFETQAYVRIVTGYAAEAWTLKPPPQLEASTAPTGARCVELAKMMRENTRRRLPLMSNPAWGPWGSSLPATGPKAASSPATNGFAASSVPFWATGCRWSCTGAGAQARRSWCGSRKRAGWTRTPYVRGCGLLAAPVSLSAIRGAEMLAAPSISRRQQERSCHSARWC